MRLVAHDAANWHRVAEMIVRTQHAQRASLRRQAVRHLLAHVVLNRPERNQVHFCSPSARCAARGAGGSCRCIFILMSSSVNTNDLSQCVTESMCRCETSSFGVN